MPCRSGESCPASATKLLRPSEVAAALGMFAFTLSDGMIGPSSNANRHDPYHTVTLADR